MTWFEIFADETGHIVVERYSQGWRFEPNKPVGRRRKPVEQPSGFDPAPAGGLQSVLPRGVTVEHWRVVPS